MQVTRLCNRSGRWQPICALAIFLGACSTGTVVLLPEKDGHDPALVVSQGDKAVLLQRPYAAVRQTPLGPRAYQSSPEEVESLFGAALAAQPMRPMQFTLYFIEGKDEFTDESRQLVEDVFAEISRRPVPDVLVIGHTDTVGTDQANDALSRQRAETVRVALIGHGIAPTSITVIGRGKRELLVPTGEGVAEPRNRRVEIIVR
jgi:outer membrane protein OmpA-like peptidoglycan-associated protein